MAIATVAAVGVGYSIYAGERSQRMQERAMEQQKRAQQLAEQRARAADRRNMLEQQRAQSKKADVTSLLEDAQNAGGNATMLTGPRGASTMLGE